MSSRRRSVRFRLAASAFIVLAVATIAEGSARTIGAEVPAWKLVDGGGVVMTGHPTRLWGLSPGVKQNGNVTATINPLGMRGPAPTEPKPAGRLRALVVGDSTWFGHGVEDEQTFPAQLEARLRADGLDVEVLNGAVPGYSTEQTRLFLDEQGWALEPDLLLVGSLWSDNNVDSFRDQDLLETARAARENPLFASHFYRLLAGAIDRARGGRGARIVTWTKDSQYPSRGGRRVSLQRYAENLDWMARTGAERGVGTAFVGPCNVGMVDGRYPDGASWDVFFDAQRQVAAHHGVPWVATLPAMRAAAGDDAEALFVDVMHPSAQGHAVFAATAADTLREAGWPEQRLLARAEPFPFDTLEDNRFGIGDANPGSPQRNLFGDVRDVGAPPLGDGGVASPSTDERVAGGGPRQQGGGVGQVASAGAEGVGGAVGDAVGAGVDGVAASATGRWSVSGTLVGGTPPLRVEARSPGGAAVSSTRLAGPGPFSLGVRGNVDAIELVVTDGAGVTTSRSVARGETVGPITLSGP